jgi:hypothetical protein
VGGVSEFFLDIYLYIVSGDYVSTWLLRPSDEITCFVKINHSCVSNEYSDRV